MCKDIKEFKESETVRDVLDEELSTEHCLSSKGAENWSIGLEIKVCSSLKRFSPLCF